MYTALLIALLLVGAAGAYVFAARRRTAQLRVACAAAFEESFAGLSPAPVFKMTYSYSYPAFTVTFATASLLAAAQQEGRAARFTAAIDRLCKEQGSSKRPFEAARAIFFTYQGQVEAMLSAMHSGAEGARK